MTGPTSTNPADASWYETDDIGALPVQGQLLLDFPIEELRYDAGVTDQIDEQLGDFIVLTHSCDFSLDRPDQRILLAGIKAIEVPTGEATKESNLVNAAHGNRPLWYLLPPAPEFGLHNYWMCSFADLTTVPAQHMFRFLAQQSPVRLKQPFREHFGYAIGRLFSRVGLDYNIWERSDFKWK